MPKKRLTKAQGKRKLITVNNAMYDFFLDKMGHSNSDVPFSIPKLLDLNKVMQSAIKRVK